MYFFWKEKVLYGSKKKQKKNKEKLVFLSFNSKNNYKYSFCVIFAEPFFIKYHAENIKM